MATPISGYQDLLENIFRNLELDDTTSTRVRNYFNELDDSSKYEMINTDKILPLIDELLKSDSKLKDLLARGDIPESSKESIKSLNKELAKLQGLIFLRKVVKASISPDSSEIINVLVDTFKTKIDAINNILKTNLEAPKEEEDEEEESSPLPPVPEPAPAPGGSKYFSFGGGKNYHQKYLNYKAKYLQLKKSL
jgi:hypothetical protein